MTTAVNLSWNWVVEALGNSEQVDPSILTDLVKRAPGISDYWGNNAREIVFLRILESLFLNGSDTATDTSSAAAAIDARIGFDTTQSCEDVHRHILNEMSPSSSTNKLERSKWDLQPLIAQKRASFTKCALEQLKEEILTGRHPLLASLKERSGLIGGDESEKRNFMVSGKEICLNPGIGVDEAEEGLSNLLHVVWDENKSVNEISGQPSSGHKSKVIDGCDLPSNESNLVSNLEADSVFIKQSITSVASQETETREDPSGGCVQHTQSQERNLPKESLMDGLEGSRFPDGCDDEHVALENIGQCCSVGDDMLHDKDSSEDNVQVNALHGTVAGKAKDKLDYSHEHVLCSEMRYEDERSALLSSQCAHPEDSLETIDSTGINLCINCNEGGQMLVCSSNACPLVIHESCLGTAATFDANQHFYCPFCAYSRAILEYNEAKRKSSLARNNLDAFLGLRNKCREKKSSKGISESVQNQPRDENLAEDSGANDDEQCVNTVSGTRCRSNEEDMVLAQPSVPSVNDNLPSIENETTVTNADNCGLTGEELEGQTLQQECEPPRKLEEQQTAGPLVHDCEPNTSSFLSNEIGHVADGSNCCLMQDKPEGQNLGQECQSPGEKEAQQIAGRNVNNSESNTSSFVCKEICHGSDRHPEVQIRHVVLNQQDTPIPHETITILGISGGEGHEPVIDASSQEDHERVISVSAQEDHEPVKDISAQEDHEPVIDTSAQEDNEPVLDVSAQEDHQPVIDVSAQEYHEPVLHVSAQEDHQPSASKYSTRLRKRKSPEPVIDISAQEDDLPSASRYSTRLRKRKPQYTYPASPLPRRKVIPWTELEIETLKEGVQKFSNAKDGVFPWKKILDFGGTVFENRNAVDLKDKWRNICKGSPIPK